MRVAPLPQARAPARTRATTPHSPRPRVMRANSGMLNRPMATMAVLRPGRDRAEHDGRDSAGKAGRSPPGASPPPPPSRAAHARPAPRRPRYDAHRDQADGDRGARDDERDDVAPPRLSVPSQCVADGGCSLFGTSISVAGKGVPQATAAQSATSSITSAAGDEVLWRSALPAVHRPIFSRGSITAYRAGRPRS